MLFFHFTGYPELSRSARARTGAVGEDGESANQFPVSFFHMRMHSSLKGIDPRRGATVSFLSQVSQSISRKA